MKKSDFPDVEIKPRGAAQSFLRDLLTQVALSKPVDKRSEDRSITVWSNKEAGYSVTTKAEFDELVLAGRFSVGPFRETFGDGYGDHYNPGKQAYGKLDSGIFVYCELLREMNDKLEAIFSGDLVRI